MLTRSIIGALAAVGAIGALAAALPERNPTRKPADASTPSFGALPKDSVLTATPDVIAGPTPDKDSLVKLAAYSAARDAASSAAPVATPASPGTVPGDPKTRSVRIVGPPPIAHPGPAVTIASAAAAAPESAPSTVPAAPSAPQSSAPPAQPRPVPQAVAALPPAQGPSASAAGAGRININRAPVSDLDRLPGGGRIGVAIARRRPYGSVDDLVRKRVLRASIFARIKSAITVD